MPEDEIPNFFVPDANDSLTAWQEMRVASERHMGRPYSDRKVYSIDYSHNGVDYVAAVGEVREATEYPRTRGQRDYSRPPKRSTSGYTVAAIFEPEDEGAPYLVWELPSDRVSPWENPSMAGSQSVSNVRTFRNE